MNKKKAVSYLCMMCFAVILLAACNKKEVITEVTGSWAQSYDKKTEVISFNEDGTVKYRDKKYESYSLSDGRIILNGDEKLELRYIKQDDVLILYEHRTYTLTDTNTPGTVIGLWENGKASYEFTTKGQFLEDGVFGGDYTVDEENHKIKLVYTGPFDPTEFYYSIENNELKTEYPYKMYPTEKG